MKFFTIIHLHISNLQPIRIKINLRFCKYLRICLHCDSCCRKRPIYKLEVWQSWSLFSVAAPRSFWWEVKLLNMSYNIYFTFRYVNLQRLSVPKWDHVFVSVFHYYLCRNYILNKRKRQKVFSLSLATLAQKTVTISSI